MGVDFKKEVTFKLVLERYMSKQNIKYTDKLNTHIQMCAQSTRQCVINAHTIT